MLDKIRNIIYDKNDIIVAACIIAVAAFVITNRMSVIFAYPEAQALALSQSGNTQTNTNANDLSSQDPLVTGDGEGEGTEGTVTTPPLTGEEAYIYVAPGDTASTIAQNLYVGGYVNSADEFLAAVDAAEAHTRLRAGEFTFPVGSTPAQIVETLTKP